MGRGRGPWGWGGHLRRWRMTRRRNIGTRGVGVFGRISSFKPCTPLDLGMGSKLYDMSFVAPVGDPVGEGWGCPTICSVPMGFKGEMNSISCRDRKRGYFPQRVFSLLRASLSGSLVGGSPPSISATKVLSDSGSAVAVDLSAYSRPWNGVSAGVTFDNLNEPSKSRWAMNPTNFARIRVSGWPTGRRGTGLFFPWTPIERQQQSPYFVAGLNTIPIPFLSLRTGWDQNQDVTAGVGVTSPRNLAV
jgi:hypothetical protein